MKKYLITAAALALLTTTQAHAAQPSKPYTFYKGAYWEMFAMSRNNDGDPMCAMHSKGKTSAIWIKWTQPKGLMVQVYDMGWRLAEGTEVPLKLEFFANDRPGQSADISNSGLASPGVSGVGASVFMYISTRTRAMCCGYLVRPTG